MTREEAIHELGEWLEQMIQHGVPSHSAKRKALATAIALLSTEDMAINALSAPTGGDLISRQEAIEWIMETDPDWCVGVVRSIVDHIDEMPTARPTDGDLISRQAAIDAICEDWCNSKHKDCKTPFNQETDEYYHCDGCGDIETLLALPSAETPTVSEKHQLSEETPTDTPTDLISRQDAIDVIESRYTEQWVENDIDYNEELETALCEIKALPSARPTGRWIIEPGIGCKCSQCEFDIGNDLDWMEYVSYCPNCGARMVGEDE